MAIKQRVEQTESNFEIVPAGEYECRLVYVADLGVQEGMEYKGVKKADRQQLAVGLELIGQTNEVDGEQRPQIMWTNPFNIFSTLLDLGKEIDYYKVFDPTAVEGDMADWDEQLGKVCNITVIHAQGKGANAKNTYANIGTITPIPAKYADNVGEALTTDMCTGDADDNSNPAQRRLYGLCKIVLDRRLDGEGSDEPQADQGNGGTGAYD